MYEGGVREPLIVRWPGVGRGSVCDMPVISTDFYPTLLEMAGLPAAARQHVDGVSLAARCSRPGAPQRRALLALPALRQPGRHARLAVRAATTS